MVPNTDTLRTWFDPLADDLTAVSADVLCDVVTDRVKKLRAVMVDKRGNRFLLMRSRPNVRGQWSASRKAIP